MDGVDHSFTFEALVHLSPLITFLTVLSRFLMSLNHTAGTEKRNTSLNHLQRGWTATTDHIYHWSKCSMLMNDFSLRGKSISALSYRCSWSCRTTCVWNMSVKSRRESNIWNNFSMQKNTVQIVDFLHHLKTTSYNSKSVCIISNNEYWLK